MCRRAPGDVPGVVHHRHDAGPAARCRRVPARARATVRRLPPARRPPGPALWTQLRLHRTGVCVNLRHLSSMMSSPETLGLSAS